MKNIAIILCALVSLSLQAREVDNYMAWGIELEDSGPKIDAYLKDGMSDALKVINKKKYVYKVVNRKTRKRKKVIANWYKSCEMTAHRMMREAFYSPTYQKIEGHIDNSKTLDTYPKRPSTEDIHQRALLGETPENGYMDDMEYLRRSIVRKSPLNSPLSRIVNVYGIYSGADKFGHFTSFGVRYLKKLHKSMKKGRSFRKALDKVLHYGYRSEKSYVGMMFTKVFSRGDLEANYQGLVFSSSLCEEGSKFKLVHNGSDWVFENLDSFTIKDYINPDWDESYNNSIFTNKRWSNAVVKTFKERSYCDLFENEQVIKQRKFYATFNSDSLNKEYETYWLPKKFEDFNPKDHSLDSFCNL
jgi:hypothetical protein